MRQQTASSFCSAPASSVDDSKARSTSIFFASHARTSGSQFIRSLIIIRLTIGIWQLPSEVFRVLDRRFRNRHRWI